MLSKNQIKYLKSLQHKKFRQKYNIFIAEGDKIAIDTITTLSYRIQAIYALNKWIMHNHNILKEGIQIFEITEQELKAISSLKTPNQVLLVVEKPENEVNYKLISKGYSIFLDNIQDPGNVGTIIRIADWFGFKAVIASLNTADLYQPKVIQASMGSYCRVQLGVMSYEELHKNLINVPFYIAEAGGQDVFQYKFSKNGILVVGNEGRGLSETVLSKNGQRIAIPKPSDSDIDSLNVAIATGIIASAMASNK